MKKTKQPGDNISLKTKKTEDPSVMQWINAQTNLMDSIRFLIERELHENGVRNLQAFIPAERSFTAAVQPSPGREAAQAAIEHSPIAASAQQLENRPIENASEQLVKKLEEESREKQQEKAEEKVHEKPQEKLQDKALVPLVEDDIDEDDIESWI